METGCFERRRVKPMNRPARLDIRDRETLIGSALLAQLGAPSLAVMMEMATILPLPPNQVLFRAGEQPDHVYCVLSGLVRAYQLEPAGREADIAHYGPGAFFGIGALFDDGPHALHAQVAEAAVVARFELRRMRETVSGRFDLALALAGTLAGQLACAHRTIADDRLHTAPQRVARYLLSLCPTEGVAASVRLPYQKSLLAAKLGLAPEALSRAFSLLRAHGVHVHGRLVQINDPDGLRRL